MVGLAVSGLLLFRRLVPQSRLEKSMSVTGQAFTLVGVLYPLVAAFALTTAWDNFQSAQDATEQEAGAVTELLNASEAGEEAAGFRRANSGSRCTSEALPPV